jgi:hypothetical protein
MRRQQGLRNTSGAIEGMPLQLLIMVIVAVIVVGIILGWIYILSDTDPLIDRIVVEPDEVHLSSAATPSIKITVLDTDGNNVNGVVIVISGCNLDIVKELESGSGNIQLTGIELPYGRPTGYLSIVAERSGMGKKTTDVVVFQGL